MSINKSIAYLFLISSFIISCIGKKTIYKDSLEDNKAIDIFDGFKLLSTPRSDIQLGSVWIPNFGPIDSGVTTDKILKSQSLSSLEFEKDQSFTAGVIITISKFLDFDPSINRSKSNKVVLNNVEVVRIENLMDLHLSPQQNYVWEGIKLNDFEIKDSTANLLKIKAKFLEKVKTKDLDITASLKGKGDNKLIIKGAGLFVAYRILSFQSNSITNSDTIDTRYSSYDLFKYGSLGNNYRIKFSILTREVINQAIIEMNTIPDLWQNKICGKCGNYMTIESLDELIDGKPKERKWMINCSGACGGVGSYFIRSYFSDEYFIFDELMINDMQMKGGETGFKGELYLTSRKYNLISLPNPSAPGW